MKGKRSHQILKTDPETEVARDRQKNGQNDRKTDPKRGAGGGVMLRRKSKGRKKERRKDKGLKRRRRQ